MVTLDSKTFEFGVIRTLGLSKLGVAQLILVQALCFVLPGIILGLAVSIPLLVLISSLLENNLLVKIPIVPTGTAFVWAMIVGVLIPLVSSYYPVKASLSKDLHSSLDLSRSKTKAVKIEVQVVSKKIPWVQITFGIFTVVFGVALYILLPLSLLSENMGLMLWLFFVILLGFLVGLSLLSFNLLFLVEKILTRVFFFWTSFSFRTLIGKNLDAHRFRNKQVALMYMLSLGFVIFIKIALDQELTSAVYETQATRGAYIQVTGLTTVSRVEDLETALYEATGNYIENYAWITEDLNTYLDYKQMGTASVTHKGQLYYQEAKIVGVSSSIFKTSLNKFLRVAKSDDKTGLDLGEQLYTPRGSEGVIVGESYRKYFGASIEKEGTVVIDVDAGENSKKEELRVLASLNSAPTFTFSNNPTVTDQHVLVSFPTFRRLLGNVVRRMEDLPLQKLLVKAIGDTNENLDKVYNLLSRLQQEKYPSLKIWDFRDSENGLESNKNALSIIFYAVEIVVIILSLFSLTTSMTTNIFEQTKEIAVMKSLGVRKHFINLLYVAEAFVLVCSSALFGILIGTLVGYVFALQRILFTQLPLRFSFPYIDMVIIFAMAIVSAFLSSFLPASRITRLNISQIARLGA